ncbi:ATP-binding protein [Streptomyces sp. WAC02707]|uniref:AlbA family DNA-binding domain-containing protein n=1 Tax=Streptomyces sp. WAC02707 TaxID=2487417 RepID=UPI000F7B9D31|nr:ATP-binding protein [Streptomyces sp. WAC02707]RSS97487.1 ATP-binding protein [Streptomyces sp. WAC02707]
MTLDFRADEPVVGLARQRELIQAVLDASSADETRWLEWKSCLDLSKAEGAFAVSKAILGFANRMPDVAEQWAEGHAYLLVGVEENVVHGVTKYDSTEIDAWLGRYLGDFGRYQPTYVPFDNGEGLRDVLLIDVFPPRWGDPIHPLRKNHQSYYPGTVFHRYAGMTQPARAAEIDALTHRAQRAAKRVSVDVAHVAGTVALLTPTEDLRSDFLDVLREDLLKQLGPASPDKKNNTAGDYSFAPAFDVFRALPPTEHRSPESFREEVEEYLRDFDRAMQQSLVQAIRDAGEPLTLKLTNPREENLTKVEVVLSLPDTILAHVTDNDEEVDWPEPPKKYGTAPLPIGAEVFAGMAAVGPPAFSLSSLQGPDIEREEGRTIIRFAPVDLRPHESVTLDPITLYSTQEAVPGPFVGEWRATATNVSGKVQRHLAIPTQRLELDMATALLSRRDYDAEE